MSNKFYIFGVICVIFALAIYQYQKQGRQTLSIEKRTAFALWKIIENRTSSYRKIAVGTNANIDLIVSGVALLRELGVEERGAGKECSDISSLDVLEECFSYFMDKGAAAERPITTQDLNSQIISAILRLPEAQTQHFVGGNAALVGLKFTKLLSEAQVMLCGPVGPKLATLLPTSIVVPDNCTMTGDENHLILEYQRQEKWGNIVAPVANRFIMSHDVANSALSTLEAFIEETIVFKPNLIVVSGFHLLDSQDSELWQQRITAAAVAFSRLPRSVPVHLELASMSQCPVMVAIVKQLFPLVNSIGLNEQELTFISRCLGGRHAEMRAVKKEDEIGFYSDIASWILEQYGLISLENSRLSRVHFHCLYVHILVVVPQHWSSNEASVGKGAWTAFSQACDTEVADNDNAELRIPREFITSLLSPNTIKFNSDDPISVVYNDAIRLHISPVLVCKRPLKTVGLGDAISASGLLYNEFNE
ncbi:ADP-dependent glucokinase-like [Dendronephthya gigantea]|uniref:ADP-dependent glucokinase-like n=1 Tax=Dendronephthya gigantea TaxID=151771 RepID=UPI00106A892D|nr:ADP-dependent glucokinase-like [Dendronephthya gigantea]